MSILEEAIVDAKALKEAALKNAEALVVEKYSDKIKEAVGDLLEQGEEDELDLGLGDEGGLGDEMGLDAPEGMSDVGDRIPLAGSEDELSGCCGEEEEIEIDFAELEQALEMDDEVSSEEMVDREGLADELAGEEEPDGLPMMEGEEVTEEGCDKDLDEEIELDDERLEEIAEGEEVTEEGWTPRHQRNTREVVINKYISLYKDVYGVSPKNNTFSNLPTEEIQEKIDDIYINMEKEELDEEVIIDQENVPNGWQGANSMEKEIAQDVTLAKAANDEETKEEIDQLKAVEKTLNENLAKSRKENKQLKSLVSEAKKKLEELNLMNVKLTYKNKVLSDNSLNGQQRTQIAESISKATTVEETKTIFETVSNVAGGNKKRAPQSLREAVQSRSATPFLRRSENKTVNPAVERMKIIAGIKKVN